MAVFCCGDFLHFIFWNIQHNYNLYLDWYWVNYYGRDSSTNIQNVLSIDNISKKILRFTKDNFDIFLPNWLAKNNKLIFTTIFIIGLIMVIINTIQR